MSDGTLDALAGILPVIVVGGVAMKMTQGIFGCQKGGNCPPSRGRVTRSRQINRNPRIGRGTNLSFGNFSNLGALGR